MGLLDEAKEKASKYISPKDFLCFLSYKLEEPIGEVASFLLYNDFDELVYEYYIDDHYRVYESNFFGNSFRTITLFNEIKKHGFTDYTMFCNQFYDDCLDGDEPHLDSHDPIPIDVNFCYSLEALQEMPFIQELDLPLEEASTLDYTVYNDDLVKAKKSKDERMFKLIDMKSHVTVEDVKSSIKDRGHYLPADIFEAIITDKIPAPTVTQTEPPNNSQLIKELAAAKAQITDLENQLAQAKAALADKPADEVELNPKTRTSATRIMNVLFHKAQLDITAHQGTTNKTIVNLSKSLNAKITEKPVIFWIKEVQQLRIDTEKDN